VYGFSYTHTHGVGTTIRVYQIKNMLLIEREMASTFPRIDFGV
jgi:hypothetical protein